MVTSSLIVKYSSPPGHKARMSAFTILHFHFIHSLEILTNTVWLNIKI